MQRNSLANVDLGNKRHIFVTLRIFGIFYRHHCKKMERRVQFPVHTAESARGSRRTAIFTVNFLKPRGFFYIRYHQAEY